MVSFGILIALVVSIFLRPIMLLFGATEATLPLSMTYTRIIALGFPFLIFNAGCSNLIRADGSAAYSMVSTISGAIINVALDALFLLVFGWGVAGAALATILGQIVSAAISLAYMFKFKTVKLTKRVFIPQRVYIKGIVTLGVANFFNQFIMMLVQVILNNSLKHYGSLSAYGSDIPFAVVAVISKVSMIIVSLVVGIAMGCQPIFGFNYGAKNYKRVEETYRKAAMISFTIALFLYAILQLFPRHIVGIFGGGSPAYFEFAVRYVRIYMMLLFAWSVQPLIGNFFIALGKAKQGIILLLSRQGLFLIPTLLILPRFFGLNGVLYAAPVADGLASLMAVCFITVEMRKLRALQAGTGN
jgi:putative MATE family efflux protein